MTNQKYEYFTRGMLEDPKAAAINYFFNIDKPHKFDDGVKMFNNCASDVYATLDPQNGDLLTDILYNFTDLFVVNEKTKEILFKEGLDKDFIEYIPFQLKNKKKKIIKGVQYYIVNPTNKIECVDRSSSKFSTRDDGVTIIEISCLHLINDKIPKDAKLFRLKECSNIIVYRSDLINVFKKNKLSGLPLSAMGEKIW